MTTSSDPHRSARPVKRRFGLQAKVVGFLLVIAMVPLVVAGVLINQSAQVAHNFATNETAALKPPLEKAKGAYLELISAKTKLYFPQVALRVAALPIVVATAAGQTDTKDVQTRLDDVLAQTPELVKITIRARTGAILIERTTTTPVGVDTSEWRELVTEQPIAGTDATLALTFAVDLQLQQDAAALVRALENAKHIETVRSALPSSYQMAFLLLVGGVVLLVSLIGIWVARRFTRRIYALVSVTRRVAGGNLEERADAKGKDELSELAQAFNRMVEELAHDREQISYLQRISTWQDVARKLAHEIKNPLTPIQLAVQQCVSSYKGDDSRYGRTLSDTEEIVTEEIANLRRLVDAFRTLGQLPRVAPEPLSLTEVVEDLHRDPMFVDTLDIQAPDQPVKIRGDRLLLRRVLTNLVENGVHAGQDADRDGRVTVRWIVDHEHERVRVFVDDEGQGVPESRRDAIFEPYVTHKEQGTGLGLAISKKIALEHGGSLSLSRESSPNGGARFVLVLPIADDTDDDVAPDS